MAGVRRGGKGERGAREARKDRTREDRGNGRLRGRYSLFRPLINYAKPTQLRNVWLQETMILENTSPIHGPLPMIIFLNLILTRGQASRLF